MHLHPPHPILYSHTPIPHSPARFIINIASLFFPVSVSRLQIVRVYFLQVNNTTGPVWVAKYKAYHQSLSPSDTAFKPTKHITWKSGDSQSQQRQQFTWIVWDNVQTTKFHHGHGQFSTHSLALLPPRQQLQYLRYPLNYLCLFCQICLKYLKYIGYRQCWLGRLFIPHWPTTCWWRRWRHENGGIESMRMLFWARCHSGRK